MIEKVEYLGDLLKSCFLPELKKDFDELPLQSDHFSEYRKVLELQLPTLYDFIQQNEKWLWDGQDQGVLELHVSLLLLLCEITESAAEYTLENDYLLKNANKLLQKGIKGLTDSLEKEIYVFYKTKLKPECWKRQLGAVHGLIRFLELRYPTGNNRCMPKDYVMFFLAVGLNLQDCHEPAYKFFGSQIFYRILSNAKRDDIKELNIHGVIYEALFKNINTMETVTQIEAIWSCLLLCVDFYEDIDSLTWNMTDDMMEALIKSIAFTSDAFICICLLKVLTKIGSYFSDNRETIEMVLNANNQYSSEMMTQCRSKCREHNSYNIFRWAKSIIQIFASEAYRLLTGADICRSLLLEMHKCYMVYILPIPLQLSSHILIPFLSKFIGSLMETLVSQKQEPDIIGLIKSFVETFHYQLKSSDHCEENPELLNYRKSIEELLKETIFL